MRTYYLFQAVNSPDLRGFTDKLPGASLPMDLGPWALMQAIEPHEEWKLAISRAVVAAGILENGFYLWGPVERTDAYHSTIASDRVEGTVVFGRGNEQIGTIKRLFIEKLSGHVTYVDVSFGGFLGMGSRHVTIPWEKLTYDKELEGYRTDLVEDQVRAASTAVATNAFPQAGSAI
ncbi:MAG TPA: PRC-barrel domain-containing protein [Bosea sp. (in: a-proteobacteria)]|uniref:PRC-barrel domain-containing protein n=1 Tax=Bosea sp. (in: a-proteobacteria) TaxID=1871050 RepID=UPI002E12819E|nr:PRC-barrel domain-containing protein [Bosea sp. (in: a-proteobacteria)]